MGCLPRMPKCCPKLCSLQRGRSHHSHRFFKSGRGLQLQCSFRCQVCGCLLPKNESHEQTYIYISRRSFLTAENRSMFSCESVLEIWKCSKNPRFYSQVGYMSIHLIPLDPLSWISTPVETCWNYESQEQRFEVLGEAWHIMAL